MTYGAFHVKSFNNNKKTLSPILFQFFLLHFLGEKRVNSSPRHGSSNFDRNAMPWNCQALVSQALWHLWRRSIAHFEGLWKLYYSDDKNMQAQFILKPTWNLYTLTPQVAENFSKLFLLAVIVLELLNNSLQELELDSFFKTPRPWCLFWNIAYMWFNGRLYSNKPESITIQHHSVYE